MKSNKNNLEVASATFGYFMLSACAACVLGLVNAYEPIIYTKIGHTIDQLTGIGMITLIVIAVSLLFSFLTLKK